MFDKRMKFCRSESLIIQVNKKNWRNSKNIYLYVFRFDLDGVKTFLRISERVFRQVIFNFLIKCEKKCFFGVFSLEQLLKLKLALILFSVLKTFVSKNPIE